MFTKVKPSQKIIPCKLLVFSVTTVRLLTTARTPAYEKYTNFENLRSDLVVLLHTGVSSLFVPNVSSATLLTSALIALFLTLASHLCILSRVVVWYSFLHQFCLGTLLVYGDFNVVRLPYECSEQAWTDTVVGWILERVVYGDGSTDRQVVALQKRGNVC